MATSSNFGNMFSAAAASAFLKFLPMLPVEILANNLLYDGSQMTIPTDHVDEEMLARPSAWDLGFIRSFMVFFGPLSSIFDFLTFAVMLGLLHAHAAEHYRERQEIQGGAEGTAEDHENSDAAQIPRRRSGQQFLDDVLDPERHRT